MNSWVGAATISLKDMKFAADEAQKAFKNSSKLSEIDPSKIVGIFGAGGHGTSSFHCPPIPFI